MTDDENNDRTQDQRRQRRTRRLSIFLILGVVAVVAIGIWVVSSWYARHYGNQKTLEQLPPPPSIGNQASGARPK